MSEQAYHDVLVGQTTSLLDFWVTQGKLDPIEVAHLKQKLVANVNSLTRAQSTSTLHNVQPAIQQQQPARHVPPVPARMPMQAASIPPKQMCRAVWPYQSQTPGDLTFEKGDLLEILKEENEHWYYGKNPAGMEGLFPTNHVEKISNDPSIQSPQPQHYSQPSYNSYTSQAPIPPASNAIMNSPEKQGYYSQGQAVYQPQQIPQQQMQPYQTQQIQVQDQKPGRFGGGGMKNSLAHSAVSGVGFGAGAAVGSGIINAIF